MKVAMLAYTYYETDPRVRRAAEALVADGVEVHFIALRRKGQPARDDINGVRLFRLRQSRYRGAGIFQYVFGYGLFFVLAFLKLTLLHIRNRYRVVHINTMPDFVVFAALVPKLFGARIILDIHDTMPELFVTKFGRRNVVVKLLELEEKLSARFANRVFAVNRVQRRKLLERGIPAAKVDIIHNFPDEKVFTPVKVKKRGAPHLFYHGTIARRHGLDTLLKACRILQDEAVEWKASIIGEGDFLEELAALAGALGIADRVFFSRGFVPVEELPALISAADVAVIPNHKDVTTDLMLPVKLLEYLRMGVPCVVSRIATVTEYLKNGEAAFFSPGDERDLARVLKELVSSKEARRELVKKGKTFGRRNSWEAERRRYVAIVKNLA